MIFSYFKKIFSKKKEMINIPEKIYPHSILRKEDFYFDGLKYDQLEFTYESYLHFVNENFSDTNLKEKEKLINLILEDLSIIHELFTPLRENEISYSILLTGGAVRDLILGKPISDLDLFIQIQENPIKFFRASNQNITEKSSSLIEYLIKNKNMDYSFNDLDINHFVFKDMYVNLKQYLNGIIDLPLKNFKSQLLIGNNDFLPSIFDFDLCKAHLVIEDTTQNKNFPLINEFFSRLHYSPYFIGNILTKKITYNNDDRNLEQCHHELTYHLSKLLKKYPDYEVIIKHNKADNYDYCKEILQKTQLYLSLENKLVTEDKKIIKKSKI